ncbi:MAG: CRISPR-associated protein Cas5 [Desulfobacterales bacterium]|nr:CRISPR-associated protein Cas5 [Desulfobacterales bacterium]
MEILAFDVSGKFAHFRKFYSNSSALTHFIPPRTTIIGMIAGISGLPRDSYYDDFSLEHCDIGVRLLSRVRKSIQTVKYLKVESLSHLDGSYVDKNLFQRTPHTRVPFEFLSPLAIRDRDSFVSYRFYYRSKTDKNKPYFEKFKQQLAKGEYYYPLSLGTANFTAFISQFNLYEKVEVLNAENKEISIDSAIPMNCLERFPNDGNYHLVQETLPMDFDKERYLKSHSEILFDLNCNSLNVKLKSDCFLLKGNNQTENILFMR